MKGNKCELQIEIWIGFFWFVVSPAQKYIYFNILDLNLEFYITLSLDTRED